MKKLLCLGLLVLLVGCTQKANVKPITRSISFIAKMTFYNECYEMSVEIFKNGDAQISMLSPEELTGLEFTVKSGEITAEFENIEINAINNFETTAVNLLYSPFKSETNQVFKKDKLLFTKGKCSGGEYTMYISETGLPLKICDNSNRFEVLIKNVTINNEKEP